MKRKNSHKLIEDMPREFMTDQEKALKKKLIALLRDDGRGHHHAMYAERLKNFAIQIVPLKIDPFFTAAIYFDSALIRISEGFLNDPATFFQLNVLLRHELAHQLLMHHIRMAFKIGEEDFVRMSFSQLHGLINTILDDEISNRKYSEEDKIIVRDMKLNGQTIGGLVTEDHRKDWLKLTAEEMYDKLCEEIAEINAEIRAGRSVEDIAAEWDKKAKDKGKKDAKGDIISNQILSTYIYSDITSPSMIPGRLSAFVERGCTIAGKRWRPEFCEIATQIYEKLSESPVSPDELKDLLLKVALASPIEVVNLFGDNKPRLVSPEEKYIAVEVLKKFKDEYTSWYDKVISSLDELGEGELQELLDMLGD